MLSHVRLFATLRTIDCQAFLSMEFSRQTYSSRLPFPPSGDPPDPGIKPVSPVSPALQVESLTTEPSGKLHTHTHTRIFFFRFFPIIGY